MNPQKFIKSNVLITAISIFSVGVSFVSQMVIAYYFGASAERDAYFSASVVPTYIVTLFVASFTVIILPYYITFKTNKQEEDIRKFISNTLGVCTLLLLILATFAFCASESIVTWIAPGFTEQQLRTTRQLFDILIFSLVFQSLTSFFGIFYHVENHFFKPAVTPIIASITSLLFVIVFGKYGIVSLAIGTLTGSFLGMLFLLPVLWSRINIKDFFMFVNTETTSVLRLAAPLFLSGAIYKLSPVAERVIASTLPPGSVSFLGYGSQIYLLLASILSGSIATTFFPMMAKAWADGSKEELNKYLMTGIRLTLFITLPIVAIIVVLAYPIVEILFERGAFDAGTTAAVSKILVFLMGALLFTCLGNMIVKLFYIAKMTTVVSIISLLEVVVYIGVGFYLSLHFSYLGLALALTISTGFTIFFSILMLAKLRIATFNAIGLDVLKLTAATIVCGSMAYLASATLSVFPWHKLLILTFSIALSVITYLGLTLYVLKIADLSNLLSSLRKNLTFKI